MKPATPVLDALGDTKAQQLARSLIVGDVDAHASIQGSSLKDDGPWNALYRVRNAIRHMHPVDGNTIIFIMDIPLFKFCLKVLRSILDHPTGVSSRVFAVAYTASKCLHVQPDFPNGQVAILIQMAPRDVLFGFTVFAKFLKLTMMDRTT